MRELTFVEAINEALHEEMARDERVFVIGEDIRIGYGKGGPFGATNGLFNRFGPDRVIDTPISESAIAGLSVGAALWGLRPIAEIMFSDFLALAMDHIANSAAKMRYAYAGEATVPVVFRMAFGAGVGAALDFPFLVDHCGVGAESAERRRPRSGRLAPVERCQSRIRPTAAKTMLTLQVALEARN